MEVSDEVELTGYRVDGGSTDFQFPVAFAGMPTDRRVRRMQWALMALAVFTVLSMILSIVAVSFAAAVQGEKSERQSSTALKIESQAEAVEISRSSKKQIGAPLKKLAFGSCTSHHVDKQQIWMNGVVPSEPDAWLWLGDFAYVDSPFLSCEGEKDITACFDCNYTIFEHPPSCQVGDLDHSLKKMNAQLESPGYKAFLEYMCPEYAHKGVFPPYGTDPEYCPRPILGIYDDHDFGWDNGNKRFPKKYLFKNLFLDAIGDLPDSSRRSFTDGIQSNYTFNPADPENSIDLIMLDGRYNRDPLPCHMRKKWCKKVLGNETSDKYDKVWCDDFLNTGGLDGGSCCKADETWEDWCQKAGPANAHYSSICDPLSADFGTLSRRQDGLDINSDITSTTWSNVQQESMFCDVLGSSQRKWFADALRESKAPLKLIASGSPLFGNHGYEGRKGACSGDDWECYHPAQLNLIHRLGSVKEGCIVVLVGDYHFSDIKVVEPGSEHSYSEWYQTDQLEKPIYQVMSSGMTSETAKYWKEEEPCSKWRKDTLGLLHANECSASFHPSFGMVEVDWTDRIVKLQIRNESTGQVAFGHDGATMELSISLDTCLRI